jgi:PiT family inorganic phosphate transporter
MSTLLLVIIFLALVFDYINGFHDAANSIATVVSTKVLTPFQAVAWAAFFNFVAFFIFKDHAVANTIAKTVKSEFITLPVIFSGLIAAIAWNLLTWWYGIPSSSSHTLIGGFAGAAIAHAIDKKGFIGISQIIEDKKVLQIILFIFLAPLIGMLVSMFLTLVIINRRFWLKTAIIVVATAGVWMVFNYLQQGKIKENLAKFYQIEKLKKDSSRAAMYQTALARFDSSVVLAKDYNKIGATAIAEEIESRGYLAGMGEPEMMDVMNTTFRLEGLKRKADQKPEFKPQADSMFALVDKTTHLYAQFGIMDNTQLADSISNIMGLHAAEYRQLLAAINGISLRKDIEKQIARANNSYLRYGIAAIALIFILSFFYVEKMRKPSALRTGSMFKKLQLLSSAIFSIGHGGNDAQKVMGIIAAAMVAEGMLVDIKEMPNWIPLACYSAIALGTMSGGWKIIKTMGTKITKVTPLEGVAAETSGAMTLFMTEQMGIPVSTTHTITGSIIGVGATKRLSAVRWGVTINLVWAWILTIPVSAVLATITYFITKLFL